MKSLLLTLFTFGLILQGSTSKASDNPVDKYYFSGFVGTGNGLSIPGPIRLRFGTVEVGTYIPAIGVTKVLPYKSVYFQLGAGLSALGRMDLGIIGAVGYEYNFWWKLGVRGELYSYVGFSGLAATGATVGLSVSF